MTQARFRPYQPLVDYAKLKEGVMIKCKDDRGFTYPCTIVKEEDPYWEVTRNGESFLIEKSEITEILEEIETKKIRFREYRADMLGTASYLCSGRVPTKWLIDNEERVSSTDFNDMSITEEQLKLKYGETEVAPRKKKEPKQTESASKHTCEKCGYTGAAEQFGDGCPACEAKIPVVSVEKKSATITPEVVIQAYIKTREEIAAKKKEFEASVASLKEVQEKRERYLASQLEKLGGESLKTGEGTCFFKTTSSATVADGQMFIDWILEDWENNNHLLERRVSKTAVDALIDDKKPVPPGINYTTMRVVQVRKA